MINAKKLFNKKINVEKLFNGNKLLTVKKEVELIKKAKEEVGKTLAL